MVNGSNMISLVPAYGRKYATRQAIQDDWNAGKDFKIYNAPAWVGCYCSIRDIARLRDMAGRDKIVIVDVPTGFHIEV